MLNDEPGVVMNVNLAGFDVQTLKVVLSAIDGGFKAQLGTNVQGVGVTTEDFDGDGALDLVTEFLHPKGPISFRVATGNMTMVGVSAHAIAFDATKLIAAADSAAPIQLPPGARESIALTLAEKDRQRCRGAHDAHDGHPDRIGQRDGQDDDSCALRVRRRLRRRRRR